MSRFFFIGVSANELVFLEKFQVYREVVKVGQRISVQSSPSIPHFLHDCGTLGKTKN